MNSKPLITSIQEISRSAKYCKKDTRLTIKKDLVPYRQYASTQEIASFDEVTKIISTATITAEMRSQLRAHVKPVIEVINRFPIDQAEAELDMCVTRYKGFTDIHPMKGVSQKRSKRGYIATIKGSRTACDSLDDACQLMIDDYLAQNTTISVLADSAKDLLTSAKCTLIKYCSPDAEYFDVQHIIHSLGVSKSTMYSKYNSVKDKIEKIIVHENQFGGCIFRELIDLEAIKHIMCFTIGPAKAFVMQLLGIKGTHCIVVNKETDCISQIQEFFSDEEMITQRTVGKYRIDLYFPKYKLAIECDENGHADRKPEREAERQKYIETALGATFIRFNPDEEGFRITAPLRLIYVHIRNKVNK